MAANTTIQIKKSAIPSAIPSDLANGEIAINYADGKLYYKNSAGYVVEFAPQTSANYFGTVNADGTLVVADTSGDVFSLIAGDNVTIVGDAINDTITISAAVQGGGDPTAAFNQANTARTHANAAYSQANTARDAANNAVTDFSPAFNQANTSRDSANLSFNQANTAYDRANTIGASSNAWANAVASYANGYAETVGTAGNNYSVTIGAASNNWTNSQIALVFAQANAAYNAANTEPDYVVANAAFAQANAAYNKANGALFITVANVAPTLGVKTGDLWFSSNVGKLFIYFTDEDSSQWIETSSNYIVTNYPTTAISSYKAFSIEAPASGDKVPIIFSANTVLLKSITPTVIGTSSNVTFSIRYGSSIELSGTEIIVGGFNINTSNSGNRITTFDYNEIPANNYIWTTISYSSGTTDWLNVTLEF